MNETSYSFSEMAKRKLLSAKARLIANDGNNWRKCKPDHPPCAICKKIIAGIPLRLFEGDLEIAFCPACAIDRYCGASTLMTPPSKNECLSCMDIETCIHVSDTVKDLTRTLIPELKDDWEDSF